MTTETGGGDSPVGPVRGVLLDPGHGGEPSEAAARMGMRYEGLGRAARQGFREECYGAINAAGYKEKTATLAVAKKLAALLGKGGLPTDMTRTTDRYVPLDERVSKTLSSRYRDWVFVSIHFNRSSAKQQATRLPARYRAPQGFEIYVLPRRGERSTAGSRAPSGYLTANNTRTANFLLAEAIATRLDAIDGLRNRGIKEAWFVVLRGSPMPAVLIEGGFMSNPAEGKNIASEDYQWKLARAVAAGILDYRSRTTAYARSAPPLRASPSLAEN